MSAATYSFKGTADMSQHNKQVEGAKKEIKKYEDEVKNAQKEASKLNNTSFNKAYSSQKRLQSTVKNTTTALNGLNGNMMGALSKFGPYAAGAAAAIGVAFKAASGVMKQSDEWTDKFKSSMEGLSGAAGQLGYQLGNLDFTGLITNMQTAWNAAKNLYNAMDALGTYTIINDDVIDEIETQLQELRTRARKGEDVADLIKQKEKELEDALKSATPRIEAAKQAAIEAALNWDSIRGNNKGWQSAQELWDQVIRYKTMDSEEIERRLKSAEYKEDQMTKGMTNAMIASMPSAWREEYTALTKEIRALEYAQKVTDDQIKAVTEQNSNLRNIRKRMAQTERLDLRYTNFTGGDKGNKNEKKDPLVGSIAYIDKQIKDLKDRLQNEVLDIPARVKIEEDIKKLENEKAMIDLQVAIGGNTDLVNAFGGLLDGVLQSGTVEEFSKNMIDIIDKVLKSDPSLQLPAVILPSKEMEDSAKETMKNLDAIIEEEYNKIIKEIMDANMELANSFSTVGSMFESLGTIMGESAGRWASVFGSILSTVGDTIAKLVALASANGVASAFELPFPANLGALATVLAGVASAVSTITSYSNQSFASGGIFEGSGSRIGDMHLARVNPGEMILNGQEQANLFRLLSQGGGNAQPQGGAVTFHISGTDLVGVLNNYDRSRARVR